MNATAQASGSRCRDWMASCRVTAVVPVTMTFPLWGYRRLLKKSACSRNYAKRCKAFFSSAPPSPRAGRAVPNTGDEWGLRLS